MEKDKNSGCLKIEQKKKKSVKPTMKFQMIETIKIP